MCVMFSVVICNSLKICFVRFEDGFRDNSMYQSLGVLTERSLLRIILHPQPCRTRDAPDPARRQGLMERPIVVSRILRSAVQQGRRPKPWMALKDDKKGYIG